MWPRKLNLVPMAVAAACGVGCSGGSETRSEEAGPEMDALEAEPADAGHIDSGPGSSDGNPYAGPPVDGCRWRPEQPDADVPRVTGEGCPMAEGDGGAEDEESPFAGLPDANVRPHPSSRPKCPETEPSGGDACTIPGLRCGYGDRPRPECRRHYECSQGRWTSTGVFFVEPCREPPDGQCPAERPEHGTRCETASPWPCEYGNALCYCPEACDTRLSGVPCKQEIGPKHWHCIPPPADPACPAKFPNVGQGCDRQGLQCKYGVLCDAPRMFCRNGVWEFAGSAGCPD